jgi:hypothetical protein
MSQSDGSVIALKKEKTVADPIAGLESTGVEPEEAKGGECNSAVVLLHRAALLAVDRQFEMDLGGPQMGERAAVVGGERRRGT